MKIVKPSADLVSHTYQPLELIERMGRICYQSEPLAAGGAEPFVRMLIKRGHESVLEHAVATFVIVCDRGVTHEIVRHRLASYSQESTRYCRYAEGIQVVSPPGLDAGALAAWQGAVCQAEDTYLRMLAADVSPQIARSVLPTCLKTQIGMTANFREWRHFIRLRTAKAAHPQIREIAGLIRASFWRCWPVIVEDIYTERGA